MKSILTTLLVLSLSFLYAFGERPESIPSKLKEIYSRGWYEEKSNQWQEYLSIDPADEAGWLEYFNATFHAGKEVGTIADQIEAQFPGSMTSYYAKAKTAGWTEEGIENLSKAAALATDDELIAEKIILSELNRELHTRAELNKLLIDADIMYHSLMNYAYNVLMSVSEGGVLFVEGEASLIPLWALQDHVGIRKDVKILSIDLAQNQHYLIRWLEDASLVAPNAEVVTLKDVIKGLPEVNPDRDFFFALTMSNDQLNELEHKLFVVGLASQYQSGPLDHYNTLIENVEQKFLLDYLTVDFEGEPKRSAGKVFETNYILPFLLVSDYYEENGATAQSDLWEQRVLKLAERSQIKTRVEMLLNERNREELSAGFKKIELDIKPIEKNMVQVKDNFYASVIEVTNNQYWFFLEYLRQNGHDELYREALVDLNKYDELTAKLLNNYHYTPVNYEALKSKAWSKHTSKFQKYPAIDMTYKAAVAYCEWLTFQYNLQEGRVYKKVLFRLPTEEEWTMAALGYKGFSSWTLEENTVTGYTDWGRKKKNEESFDLSEVEVLYPWWHANINYRDKVKNQWGCYLANIKAPEEISCKAGIKGDGFNMMSPVATYFANKMGLYDISGNVAEMISEEGLAMGGSWNHSPEESTIKSVNTYEGSDASVGFRIFMEVIEK